DIKAGFTGDMHVEQDARGGARSRDRQKRSAICKADDPIAPSRQNYRESFADGRIVVDHEDLAAGEGFLGHLPSSIESEKKLAPNSTDARQRFGLDPYSYGT